MTDRLVQQIEPHASDDADLKPFSAFLGRPNIVLLGDPGAGKSQLFRDFSAPESLLRARDFLLTPASMLQSHTTLFIDALDEKRSGRGDRNTVDAIVHRLLEVRPQKVRISCRVADWLGSSDLATFKTYFDHAGGVTVLGLEPLTPAEQLAMVRSRGVSAPEGLLDAARMQGLQELLGNPQNLVMLCDVFRKYGALPSSRGELYRQAADILLTEHNPERARDGSGVYSAAELLEPAGAICALRLIADVAGISLMNGSSDVACPSYRTVPLYAPDTVLAALGRRTFVASGVERVDYVHRTVAEYLAARWLAGRVKSGLPLGRVRALIGVEGKPASELRGLNAWLATLLPEQAATLIHADPFGVLSYGDAAAMSPATRLELFRALATLAEQDPWFREGHWSAAPIAALSGPELEEPFRAILKDRQASYSIRSIVLDALTVGQAIPSLVGELRDLCLDGSLSIHERDAALDALFNHGARGTEILIAAYPQLGASKDDLSLRAAALRRLTGAGLPVLSVAELLADAIASPDELTGGAFWQLWEGIETKDIPSVLDGWAATLALSGKDKSRRNVHEVLLVVDSLLARILASQIDIDPPRAVRWLECREALDDHYSRGHHADQVRDALRSQPQKLRRLLDFALPQFSAGSRSWLVLAKIASVFLAAPDDAGLLEVLLSLLRSSLPAPIRAEVYEMAFTCCFQIGESARPVFEHLLDDFTDADLDAARERSCLWSIPDWRIEQSERTQQRKAEREAQFARTRADFEKDQHVILAGADLGWMRWLAWVYFGLFRDVDQQSTPYVRLASQIGAENVGTAIQGLITFALRNEISTEAEILETHRNNQYCPWWYAVIAGLDEYVSASGDLTSIPDSYARAAILIDLLHNTYTRDGNVSRVIRHSWVSSWSETRAELVLSVYVSIIRVGLASDAPCIYGLNELTSFQPLGAQRSRIARELLEEFPTVSRLTLRSLLPLALKAGEPWNDSIAQNIERCRNAGKPESTVQWLAAGVLRDLDRFRASARALGAEEQKMLFWAARDLGALGISPVPGVSAIPLLTFWMELAAHHFQRAESPSEGWSGDTNPWDASQLIQRMIASLSADASEPARAALQALRNNAALSTFQDDTKHAIARQRIRIIDASFVQPSWAAAAAALSQGAPANHADLLALVMWHLRDLGPVIASSNTDMFKRFWNEDSRGNPVNPKPEDSCRDELIDLLKPRLAPYSVAVEPEGHMARNKRADIAIHVSNMKLVIELKKDLNDEVWRAMSEQLERFYTRDPQAQGFGIYGVFWFGSQRTGKISKMIGKDRTPDRAQEMEVHLQSLVPEGSREKIVPIVIDVSVAEQSR